ncbi:DUF5130 domain-containing protein [Enemella dayhoffiae]|uniref:DUF5130 domain-containing protein n=1 Tax=Enemella dayhoffiae TaxID=2016507 RepID=A0A255GZ94_9ACTN|nr:DUF5130 family protein [Enemella dayhoffiae]OYO20940.1 DUF5130 domain-containing protein [Enemella dayhoffiae]
MSGGELSGTDSARLKEAVHRAETLSGLKFSLFLGDAEGDPRRHAQQLHARLEDPADSVLVLCDPGQRALEIVTGVEARRTLTDGECRMAAASMQSNFIAGDLVGGLTHGLAQLGGYARKARVLHVTENS